jgi:hypothetical protein
VFCSEHTQKLENQMWIATDLFDWLGTATPATSERGEFTELGNPDFSRERIERFRAKISELKLEIQIRMEQLQAMQPEISSIHEELQIPLTGEQQTVFQSDKKIRCAFQCRRFHFLWHTICSLFCEQILIPSWRIKTCKLRCHPQ